MAKIEIDCVGDDYDGPSNYDGNGYLFTAHEGRKCMVMILSKHIDFLRVPYSRLSPHPSVLS